MNEIVTINEKEHPVTTSLLIAEKFKKSHDAVIKAVRKVKNECSEAGISRVKIDERKYSNRGRDYVFF